MISKTYIPFVCVIWVEVEYKYQVTTFKHNNLQSEVNKSV